MNSRFCAEVLTGKNTKQINIVKMIFFCIKTPKCNEKIISYKLILLAAQNLSLFIYLINDPDARDIKI